MAWKTPDQDAWGLMPGSLLHDFEAVCSQVQALALAGDAETQYSAVKIERSGMIPVRRDSLGRERAVIVGLRAVCN